MEYKYRNIRAVFEPLDECKCKYSFYMKHEDLEMLFARGAVCVGVEVTDLSRCALEEFARKYIDVKYGNVRSYLTDEVPKTDIPLSLAALDAASDIQYAANYIVDCCKNEQGCVTEFEHEEIAGGSGVELACIEGYCGAIARAVEEMTDGKVELSECTFIVKLPQEQNNPFVQQNQQIQMM